MPAVLEQINVMSVSEELRIMEYPQKSIALLGAASAYAKPSLRKYERMAFRRAMEAKHAAKR